jgi:hypothetical protein
MLRVLEIANEIYETPLSPEEFDRRLALARAEGDEELRELIAWFCKRYPTPLERLRHSRRVTRSWLATRAIVRDPR